MQATPPPHHFCVQICERGSSHRPSSSTAVHNLDAMPGPTSSGNAPLSATPTLVPNDEVNGVRRSIDRIVERLRRQRAGLARKRERDEAAKKEAAMEKAKVEEEAERARAEKEVALRNEAEYSRVRRIERALELLQGPGTQDEIVSQLNAEGHAMQRRTLQRIKAGDFNLKSGARGGRPPTLEVGTALAIGEAIRNSQSTAGGALSPAEVRELAEGGWKTQEQSAGRSVANPPKFSRIGRAISKAVGETAKVGQERTKDEKYDVGATPDSIYTGMMALRQVFNAVKDPGDPFGTCSSWKVFFMDETALQVQTTSSKGNRQVVFFDSAPPPVIGEPRESSHITTSAFFNMFETFVHVIVGGQTDLNLNGSGSSVPLGVDSLGFSASGSMTTSSPVDDLHGTYYFACRDFVSWLDEKYPLRKSPVVLIIDNLQVHKDVSVQEFLLKHDVLMHLIPPNTSAVTQVSDQPFLHGKQKFKKKIIEALGRYDDQGIRWERDTHLIGIAVKDVFTFENKRNAVLGVGLKFAKDSSYSRFSLSEADAREHVTKLVEKGVFGKGEPRAPSLYPLESMRVVNALVDKGVLPRGTRSIVTPDTLAFVRGAAARRKAASEVDFVDVKGGRRKTRDVPSAFTVTTGLVPGSAILNSPKLLEPRLRELALKKEEKAKKLERAASAQQRKVKQDEVVSRKKLLLEAFRTFPDKKRLDESLRAASKYYTGNNDLEKYDLSYGVAAMAKKLGVPVPLTAEQGVEATVPLPPPKPPVVTAVKETKPGVKKRGPNEENKGTNGVSVRDGKRARKAKVYEDFEQ